MTGDDLSQMKEIVLKIKYMNRIVRVCGSIVMTNSNIVTFIHKYYI